MYSLTVTSYCIGVYSICVFYSPALFVEAKSNIHAQTTIIFTLYIDFGHGPTCIFRVKVRVRVGLGLGLGLGLMLGLGLK